MKNTWGRKKFNISVIIIIVAILCTACTGAAPTGVGVTVVEVQTGNTTTVEEKASQQVDDVSPLTDMPSSSVSVSDAENDSASEDMVVEPEPEVVEEIVYRDNTPAVLVPTSPGTVVYGNEYVAIDASNVSEGYITVDYLGTNGKVKFQMTGPNGVTYTYDLTNGIDVFPVTAGSGSYTLGCFENVGGNEYAIAYTDAVNLTVTNEFGPYLYPNQYVNFNSSTRTVARGAELAAKCTCDLDVVYEVYEYTINNVTYDYDLAETVSSGYIPNVDSVLDKSSGICFDYAVLMATMLRSQGIPTRLDVGYAGMAYHAWIDVYIEDVGWIDGFIEFKGKTWTLMDPTFAANSDKNAFEEFVGDGNNYKALYVY